VTPIVAWPRREIDGSPWSGSIAWPLPDKLLDVEDSDEPIEIADYDPRWPRVFSLEAPQIVESLGSHLLGIEHIGSTAVVGLAAKPIVDIQVGVRSLDATPEIVAALEGLGYTYHPEYETELPNRRFFRKTSAGRLSHQVHVVEYSDKEWWVRHLAFRDWLREHPSDRRDYEALKRELAVRYRDDRSGYTEAKAAFVNRLTGDALQEAAGTLSD